MKVIKCRANNKTPILFREFSGLSDMISFIENTPPDEEWNNTAAESTIYNIKFSGHKSFAEAKSALLRGSNVTQIKKAVPKGANCTSKKKRTLSTIGGAPCVPAYLVGNPACMYRMKKERSRGAYNVFIDTGVSYRTTKTEIKNAGIEILIRVLRLASKYPVNLYVGDFGIYDGKIYGHATKIMDAGKAFNTARVSYALTESGFLRVFGFAIIERNNSFWDAKARSTYGKALSYIDREQAAKAVFKNAICLSTKEVIFCPDEALAPIDNLLK